ncbi:MAG: aldehyde dehydrogenase family protein [Candidatus Binatia bacterium]
MTTTALLLVDLQNDFLERRDLTPDAPTLVDRAADVLRRWRALGWPVAHVHTWTAEHGDDRMPHWKRDGTRRCVAGTIGAAPPDALAPTDGELVVRKQFYSPFADGRLAPWMAERGVSHLVLAGVYLHACIRSAALDAYERGYTVTILDDVVGTTEPSHAEATRAWLGTRVAAFTNAGEVMATLAGDARPEADGAPELPIALIAGVRHPAAALAPRYLHRDPCRSTRILAAVPLGGPTEVRAAAEVADAARRAWRASAEERAAVLEGWAAQLEAERRDLVELVMHETGKPRRFAEEEAGRAVGHARLAAELARMPPETPVAPGVTVGACPVGVVGLMTPWNNPLAIPVGKVAPALAFGNGVVWKPAPQATQTALALGDSLARAGVPSGLVNIVCGGAGAARAMCREPGIAAVSLTGAVETGRVVAALCADRLKPLQAELGGNNAAIILADADLDRLVPDLVASAFGFAGQRCTAIRRIVVEHSIATELETRLVAAIGALRVGDPADGTTDLGPLISAEKRDRLLATIARARSAGARVAIGGVIPSGLEAGAWLAPTLIADPDHGSPLAQEETFGPIAVLLRARDLHEAIAIANGVPQGLVMALYTRDAHAREIVLEAAEAGILQLTPGPLAIHARAPFIGWKASGLGPPEHGTWDAAFYTRVQARYETEPR